MKNSRTSRFSNLIALGLSALILGASAITIPPAEQGFKIAVLTDMVIQDPLVKTQGEFASLLVTTREISHANQFLHRAIFDTDRDALRENVILAETFYQAIMLPRFFTEFGSFLV